MKKLFFLILLSLTSVFSFAEKNYHNKKYDRLDANEQYDEIIKCI